MECNFCNFLLQRASKTLKRFLLRNQKVCKGALRFLLHFVDAEQPKGQLTRFCFACFMYVCMYVMTRKSYKCEQSNNWLIVHIIFQTGQSSTSKAWLISFSAATTADASKRLSAACHNSTTEGGQ